MIILGTDRRAVELARLFEVHPEAGMRVTGVIGSRREAQAAGLGGLWLGDHHDAERILAETPTTSVVVCSGDVSPTLINTADARGTPRRSRGALPSRPVRRRRAPGQGVPGRQRGAPLRRVRVAVRTDLGLKRIFDIVVAASLLLLAPPLFAVVAVLIKRDDGGPVFFRQRRVGRADNEFEMLKFRTMVVDAEARLDDLMRDNQRSGPLFKLGVDPRVTRIGTSSARRVWTSCHN